MILTVREIQAEDIQALCDYWFNADPDFLIGMGVDLSKMVDREVLEMRLSQQIDSAYPQKASYAIIWQVDGQSIGHCNVGDIEFGKQAFMHLHIWNSKFRKKGMGTDFVINSIPYFFEKLYLEVLYCQPFSNNPAPNRTLAKAGFEFVKEYVTIPGAINYEQTVKLWKMTREMYVSNLI